MQLCVGARRSPLSQVQVKEVHQALLTHYPDIEFIPHFVDTSGDQDKETSLRLMEKSDFFTGEIDLLQKEGKIRLAIHSAKDLPDPLPSYLSIGALTFGLDPTDVIVLRPSHDFDRLPSMSRIATSSKSREERVQTLRQDLQFVDIRGTIEERLEQLMNGRVDGIVMAEAALIRLGLTHLNRYKLKGQTARGQGQLACVIRKEDLELGEFLKVIDSRRAANQMDDKAYQRQS